MKILNLLSSEEKWCNNFHSAEDKNGNECHWNSPNAVKWSLLGALWHCYSESSDIYKRLINAIGSQYHGLVHYNSFAGRKFSDISNLVVLFNV